MHVSDSNEGRGSRGGNHAAGGRVEEQDDGAWRRREDSRSVETVGVAENVPRRCERSNADEAGRDRVIQVHDDSHLRFWMEASRGCCSVSSEPVHRQSS